MSDKFPEVMYLDQTAEGGYSIPKTWTISFDESGCGEKYLRADTVKQMEKHTKEAIEEAAYARGTEAERKRLISEIREMEYEYRGHYIGAFKYWANVVADLLEGK